MISIYFLKLCFEAVSWPKLNDLGVQALFLEICCMVRGLLTAIVVFICFCYVYL